MAALVGRADRPVKPYGWRDRLVVWLANQVLRLASKRYRQMVRGSIEYGLSMAAMDQEDSES